MGTVSLIDYPAAVLVREEKREVPGRTQNDYKWSITGVTEITTQNQPQYSYAKKPLHETTETDEGGTIGSRRDVTQTLKGGRFATNGVKDTGERNGYIMNGGGIKI